PGPRGGEGTGSAGERTTKLGVAQQPGESRGERVLVVGNDDTCPVPEQVGDPATLGDDGDGSGRRGLRSHHAEALVGRGEHEGIRIAVELERRRRRTPGADEVDPLADTELTGERDELAGRSPVVRADHREVNAVE